ncbi:hypothetical protein SALBM311S_08705 [Streptomyces alboniger]
MTATGPDGLSPSRERESPGRAMTVAGTLEAAEAAAPVESLDVVARMLKERFGAASVLVLVLVPRVLGPRLRPAAGTLRGLYESDRTAADRQSSR